MNLIETYETVARILQGYFRNHSPEQTENYLKNLQSRSKDAFNNSELFRVDLFYDGGPSCEILNNKGEKIEKKFPDVIMKIPPFYEIGLAKFASGFKIASISSYYHGFDDAIIQQGDVLQFDNKGNVLQFDNK